MSDAKAKPQPAEGRVSLTPYRFRRFREGPPQKSGTEESPKGGRDKELAPSVPRSGESKEDG